MIRNERIKEYAGKGTCLKCDLVTGHMGSVLEVIHASYCAGKVYENDTLRISLFYGGYVSYDAKADGSSPSPSQTLYTMRQGTGT